MGTKSSDMKLHVDIINYKSYYEVSHRVFALLSCP